MSQSKVLTHLCPNCGGPLLFDPKSQKFHCQYCLSTFTEEEVTAFEAKQEDKGIPEEIAPDVPLETDEAETPIDDQVGLFVCPSCGAEIVTDATTASTFCYYCHNPVVLSERLSGKFLPEKVLPFQIEQRDAEEAFLDWVGKKKFVPKDFFDKKQIKQLQGVYFPYWVVGADLEGQLQARANRIRVWIVGDLEYTETKQYQIIREGNSSFQDLVKNALKKNEPEKMVGAVQPFDLSKAVSFKNQYLSGFLTEKRDIEYAEIKERVDSELRQYSEALMRDTIQGYTAVTSVQSQQSIKNLESDYVLLPLWLVTYRQKNSDKLFYYAMNGQTGKTAGILPVDKMKVALVALLIFITVLILGVIVGWFVS
ncbi:TFIIB-type zinc ribbon-containing protein [Lactococcus formosensis]|uniref:TFIIB-type zinc ribbon-containing protein n=1 Tax=Lactococcus formosensis TaxID=1281486 RepID=UPI0022E27B37|nr:TFIIB-type zinc ribbon-containing protein [Lactococcus formosensis]MDT2725432.1 TFIIB-type zinc ribbon-containing protein [Lactococcus formosensis]